MPKILITGNGFDLSLGLPTKYEDFMNIMIYVEDNNTNKISYKSLYNLTSQKSNIKLSKTKYLNKTKVLEISNKLNENLWFQFFKKEPKDDINTWIDFEQKIEMVLRTFNKICKIIEEKLNSNLIVFSKVGSLINKGYPDLRNIKHYEWDILLKFEIISIYNNENYQFNKDFIQYRFNECTGIDYKGIEEYLNKQIEDFKVIFNDYIQLFIFPLYHEEYFNQKKLDYFKHFTHHFTFNYTPTFRELTEKDFTKFLHGNSQMENNNIVIGIDKISSDYSNNFSSFEKLFQTLENDTSILDFTEFNNLSEAVKIFVIGHSLDLSDKEYFNNIKKFIEEESKANLFIVYRNNQSKRKLIRNLYTLFDRETITELLNKNKIKFLLKDSKEFLDEISEDLYKDMSPSVY